MKNTKLSFIVRTEKPDGNNSFGDTSYGHLHLSLWATDTETGRSAADNLEGFGLWRDFSITGQTSSSHAGPWKPDHYYAWELAYQPCRVTSRDCESMTKLFKRIEKGMKKLSEQLGQPSTFGQYVARVSAVLGVTEIEFIAEQKGENIIRSPGDAVWIIDQATRELWEVCRNREGLPLTETNPVAA